jgi:hypothetical protein
MPGKVRIPKVVSKFKKGKEFKKLNLKKMNYPLY